MKEDVLQRAARALREQAEEAPASPEATRARIMASFRQQRARRVALIRAVVPLAAVIVGSLAWAAPGRLPALWRAATTLLDDAEPAPQGAPKTAQPLNTTPAAPAAPAEPVAPVEPMAPAEPVALAEPVAPAASDAALAGEPELAVPALQRPVKPAARPAMAAPAAQAHPNTAAAAQTAPAEAAPAEAAPVAPAAPASEQHALYKEAHRLHFVDHNPGAALAAWEVYLRVEPRGRFSTEARYNRALCLVRLGRAAEARSALDAFARGAFGGYRQAEASSLIEALDQAGKGAP